MMNENVMGVIPLSATMNETRLNETRMSATRPNGN
jgi:hypothetical protein